MRHETAKILLGVLILGILFILFFFYQKEVSSPAPVVGGILHTETMDIDLEIANTVTQIRRGLSGREELRQDRALLFVFPDSDHHGIWMKDMNFPIDILWLSEEFQVVHTVIGADPSSYPHVFRPSLPASYVLEANEGFIQTLNISLGGKLDIRLEGVEP